MTLIKVVDHYENPRNVGSLDKNSKNVGTGLVGAPACGDVMKLQVRRSREIERNKNMKSNISNTSLLKGSKVTSLYKLIFLKGNFTNLFTCLGENYLYIGGKKYYKTVCGSRGSRM